MKKKKISSCPISHFYRFLNGFWVDFDIFDIYTASYLNLLRTPFLESRLVNPGEMTHKKTSALTGDNCFCPTRTSSGRQLKSLRCSCPVPALALSLPLTPVTSGVTSLSLWRAFGGCDGD